MLQHSKENTKLQISFLHLCLCLVGGPGISSDDSYSAKIFTSFIATVPPSGHALMIALS
jgi:hypothetical protein